jgi:DNA sulfur modification protein DndD
VKFQSITLTNFRQFAGAQTVNLSVDSIRPVSILFGANGAGKTAFLNAFTWGLYGTMSEDVEQQERLVSDSVWRELPIGGTVEVTVEIYFDHENFNYRALRRASVLKESYEQARKPETVVELWKRLSDGSSESVGAPQQTILSILPKAVSRFFFFNGERIENLVKKGAYTEVQQDIKVLLDLEQVERALIHLPKVDRRLTNELRKHGDARASEIQDAIDGLREHEQRSRENCKLLESNLAGLIEERDSVLELLRQHNEARPIQERRDAVSRELDEAKNALEAAKAEQRHLVATRGFLAFTEDLGKETEQLADGLYQKGTLPAPLKREFVDRLLDEGFCICGTELTENGAPRARVQEWQQSAGLQEVEIAWQRLRGQIASLGDARDEVHSNLTAIMRRIGSDRDRRDRLVEQKSELDGKLHNSHLEDVQALESKRIGLDNRIGVCQQKLGSGQSELDRLAKEIEQKTRERSNAELKDDLAAKARARSDLVQNVKKALDEIHAIREEDMRQRLDGKLKDVFRKITHQNHIPTLSKGFELTLHKNVGDGEALQVPKSTGENQILSLSFVAAVSELAREIRKESRAEGGSKEDSGTYPIVMDAAFGSLDQDYQQAVSRVLARMAPQLVVLVSKSQGLGDVVTELLPYVEHFGVIETRSASADMASDDIELEGISYPYIRPGEADYSELRTIK